MSQFERNQKILVSKDVTANATGLADLDSGELIVLKADGTLLQPGETIADSPYITIVQGTNDANAAATGYLPKFSQKIIGKNVVGYTGQSYTPAVPQVVTIADGTASVTTASASEDTEYTIYLVFKQDKVVGSKQQLRRSISYLAPAGTTIANVLVGLAAAINADSVCASYVTADINAGDLRITGKAQTYSSIDGLEQVNFEVSEIDGTLTCAVVYTTPATPGVGTYAKVAQLENFALGNNGITNRTKFPVQTGAGEIFALTTENYDMYVIDHFDKYISGSNNGEVESPLQTIIAVPYDAAAANGVALEALLNPYFASCPGAFASVVL